MKRCNNCGWFNLDSAVECEKCGDESFKPIIEEEVQVVEEQPAAVVYVEQKEEEMAQEESVVEETDSGVALPHNAMTSTVMLGTGYINRPDKNSHCPKCRYPIVGNLDCCPNCGATVKNETEATVSEPVEVKPLEKHREAADKSFDPKATVRDLPEDLMADEKEKEKGEKVEKEIYKLVSIDTIGALPVVLELDKIVFISENGMEEYK